MHTEQSDFMHHGHCTVFPETTNHLKIQSKKYFSMMLGTLRATNSMPLFAPLLNFSISFGGILWQRVKDTVPFNYCSLDPVSAIIYLNY